MEQEGVIKYTLTHQNQSLNKYIQLSEINAWRSILFKLQLIGQIKHRYNGYGFGNISQRIDSDTSKKAQFVITGTQTGHLETLTEDHFCTVLEADPQRNMLKSSGTIKPSSEALTHASVYQQNDDIKSVIHVHCPEIWKNSHQLHLPYTCKEIAYGTAEMANEVDRLFKTSPISKTQVFSMLGHEDGIIAFSDTMESAACLLIKYYSKAIELEPK